MTFPQRLSGWDDRVVIRDATTGAFAGSAAVNAHTNAYSVGNLVPGAYRAEFARDFGYDVAEAQFFDGKAEHLGVASSQTFTLAAGATRAGVSAVLVEGGRLTGRVRDTASNPVAGCVVTAYSSDGTRVGRESRPSAADGTYAVPGLTTGSYLLRLVGGGCGSTTSYYDGAGTVSPSAGSAVAVSAPARQHRRPAGPRHRTARRTADGQQQRCRRSATPPPRWARRSPRPPAPGRRPTAPTRTSGSPAARPSPARRRAATPSSR